MAKIARSRLLVWVAGLLVLTGCSGDRAPVGSTAQPDAHEIAAALASYDGQVTDFDQIRAIVVAHDDRIAFQHYYGTTPQAYWDVESVTKSVVSTLVGIALAEGRIEGLDHTLAELLPRQAHDMSQAVAGTTLRQLLTMTGGLPSGTASASGPLFASSGAWVRAILRHPTTAPGGGFSYSNASAHLVAAILQHATGMSPLAYARSRLFGPLGIPTRPAMHGPVRSGRLGAWKRAHFAWPTDPQGVGTGWWGLKLRPVDMVKLGELYLGDGRWQDQPLVPADWIHDATSPQVDASDSPIGAGTGYGYLWWTGHVDGSATFTAAGYGGQLIVVVPDRHLVVVTATELRLGDPTSNGIDLEVLQTIVDDAIISKFPRD